jgi:hypothetical protein
MGEGLSDRLEFHDAVQQVGALQAQHLATSSWLMSGSRVVRACSARPGAMTAATTGSSILAAPHLMISYAMPAMTGMKTMRDPMRMIQDSGRPRGASTAMARSATISRKFVPQRGWRML